MKGKFYTKTLAMLYAQQGYFDDAEKGFKSLLELEPDRADYLNELAKLPKIKKEKMKTDLVSLVKEWDNLVEKGTEKWLI